jgi:hypothetical protein
VGGSPGIRVNSSNVMTWGRNPVAFDMFGRSAMPQNPIPDSRGIFGR